MDRIKISITQLENWNYAGTKPECVGNYQIFVYDIPDVSDFYNLAREVEDIICKEKGDGWESSVTKSRFEHGASAESGLINIILHDPAINATMHLLGVLLVIQIRRLVDRYCPEPAKELGELKLEDAIELAKTRLSESFSISPEALNGGQMKLDNGLLTVEFKNDKSYVYTRTGKGVESCYWHIDYK